MPQKKMNHRLSVLSICCIVLLFMAVGSTLYAQSQPQPLPKITIGVDQSTKPGDFAATLQILLILTVLSLTPAIVVMMTSFTRIAIVFTFLKQGLSTHHAPPTQVLIGLALFLTLFVMAPTGTKVYEEAVQPYMEGQLSQSEAYGKAVTPLKDFMIRQTREKDLALFVNLSKMERPATREEVPIHILIPAFIISEFRIAFQIGFLLYLPLIIIDLVIASVLMSMGMMMLPPMMISLPFKLILFVLVDGWYLIVGSILQGFK